MTAKEKFNAGNLINVGGYQAYSPNKINHNFYFTNNKTLILLEQASAALGKLNYLCQKIYFSDESSNMYFDMLTIFEALKSGAIEGTNANVEELLTDDSKNKDRDSTEILNLFEIMIKYCLNNKKTKTDIANIKTIEKINSDLFKGIEKKEKFTGKIRDKQNYIGGNDELSALFVPPPPSMLKELLDDLNAFWINSNLFLPILIKIAIYHYQFETIHPFLDGNGRTGRILINLQLKESHLLDFPVFCLSDYWSRNKGQYYDALTVVRFSHDIEYWIRFFLKSIIDTCEERITTIENIEELRKKYIKQFDEISRMPQNYNKLLDQLFKCPHITINKAQEILKLSYQGTSKIIQNFVDLGILEEDKSKKRNRIFIFKEYRNIIFKSLFKED